MAIRHNLITKSFSILMFLSMPALASLSVVARLCEPEKLPMLDVEVKIPVSFPFSCSSYLSISSFFSVIFPCISS